MQERIYIYLVKCKTTIFCFNSRDYAQSLNIPLYQEVSSNNATLGNANNKFANKAIKCKFALR
jgi:hypothetical protein